MPDPMNLKVGKIQITRKGFAFLTPENENEEFYIRAEDTKTALNGDRVVIRIKPYKTGKKREAEVVKVLERARQLIIGTYYKAKFYEYCEPDDPAIKRNIYILPDHGLAAEDGQKVAVMLKEWTNEFLNPEGRLVEVIGFPYENGVDILTIIKKYNLPTDFDPAVENEADKIKLEITPGEVKRRRDLRGEIQFTIDPASARDFDDAVSLKTNQAGNYLLGVHIADVSHYVRENSELDKEAVNRGTSVYLVDRVLPMLPENLSNNICSLNPDEDRLTYSCEMELTPRGRVVKYDIFKSVIHSNARLNYDQVQEFFDTGKQDGILPEVCEALKPLRKLAALLRKKRFKAGSIDFDLPEPLVLLDKSGEVIDIRPRPRKESHKLIEEFMLLANKCVAEYFVRLGLPTLFRVHDLPDPEKLLAFKEFARTFGHDLKLAEPLRPKQLSDFLHRIEGQPEEELLNELLLRSLKKAVYQRENIGHFGLAFKNYLHFTSPIRRYPDMMVHRLLSEIRRKNYPPHRQKTVKADLDKIGEHCSSMEVIAEKAERESIKVKQVLYLSRHIGDIYEGIVSGMVSGGFFVRLIKFSAEGRSVSPSRCSQESPPSCER